MPAVTCLAGSILDVRRLGCVQRRRAQARTWTDSVWSSEGRGFPFPCRPTLLAALEVPLTAGTDSVFVGCGWAS